MEEIRRISLKHKVSPYVKHVASCWNLMYDVGSSNLVFCDNVEVGWDGGEREVQREEHLYNYGSFMLLYNRNQHNILRQLSSSKK